MKKSFKIISVILGIFIICGCVNTKEDALQSASLSRLESEVKMYKSALENYCLAMKITQYNNDEMCTVVEKGKYLRVQLGNNGSDAAELDDGIEVCKDKKSGNLIAEFDNTGHVIKLKMARIGYGNVYFDGNTWNAISSNKTTIKDVCNAKK